jgi:hypothetical protein
LNTFRGLYSLHTQMVVFKWTISQKWTKIILYKFIFVFYNLPRINVFINNFFQLASGIVEMIRPIRKICVFRVSRPTLLFTTNPYVIDEKRMHSIAISVTVTRFYNFLRHLLFYALLSFRCWKLYKKNIISKDLW